MAFCMSMIVVDKTNSNIFLPIITGILGYWLPSPKLGASKLRSLGNTNVSIPVNTSAPVDTSNTEDNTDQA